MRKLLLICLLLIICTHHFAQSQNTALKEVGYKIDMYGKPLDGYLSTDYENRTDFKVIKNTYGDFVKAHYYDLSGQKITGHIKYNLSRKDFKFKERVSANVPNLFQEIESVGARNISARECTSFVIASDSFTVVDNFTIQNKLSPFLVVSKSFFQVLDQHHNTAYYKYYSGGLNTNNAHYFLKDVGSSNYQAFPKSRKDFIEFCEKHFSEFPALVEQIKEKKYVETDVPTLIKLYKYKLAELNDEKIYFDKMWREIEGSDDMQYYAKIDSSRNTSFFISYFTREDIKLYSGQFKSFYPHLKKGIFTWYYPNGNKRKQINYVDNKPYVVFTYYPGGEKYETYKYDENNIRVFSTVNDSAGINQLDKTGSGKNIFFDPIAQRTIFNRYDRGYLMESYYKEKSGRKIYLIAPKDIKFKRRKAFSQKLQSSFEYPEKSFRSGSSGTVLVEMIVEPSGLASDIRILSGIDAEINSALISYLSYLKVEKHWKAGEIEGDKVPFEIVLPFEFEIDTFKPYYRSNLFWMDHMMFQQQMMMPQQNLNHISPPSRF